MRLIYLPSFSRIFFINPSTKTDTKEIVNVYVSFDIPAAIFLTFQLFVMLSWFFSFLGKICNKKFYNTSYWRHMSTVHAPDSKLVHVSSKYEIFQLSSSIVTAFSFVFHVQECKFCDRKFSFQFKLNLHEKSHVSYEEREFVCTKVSCNIYICMQFGIFFFFTWKYFPFFLFEIVPRWETICYQK